MTKPTNPPRITALGVPRPSRRTGMEGVSMTVIVGVSRTSSIFGLLGRLLKRGHYLPKQCHVGLEPLPLEIQRGRVPVVPIGLHEVLHAILSHAQLSSHRLKAFLGEAALGARSRFAVDGD